MKVGDYVLIYNKKQERITPQWVPAMDNYLGKATIITKHLGHTDDEKELVKLKIDNERWTWEKRWLKPITKAEYTSLLI